VSDLAAARLGDERAFERLVAGHRHELHVHCYRMLGGIHDAEDAVQETLVAAWRGLGSFQERSSLRAWLYRIATNCCLRLARSRPQRRLSWDLAPARSPEDDLGSPGAEPVWIEPLVETDPAEAFGRRETVELAYVAALQHLPAKQRAVLVLCEVMQFPAVEVAGLLETTPAAVNSALQRARATLARLTPQSTQQHERLEADERRVVEAFVEAFVAADVRALVELLTEDVRFSMPPLPAWFDGLEDVAGFYEKRVFATRWRVLPWPDVNGQPAVMGYQEQEGEFRRSALMVFSFRDGRVSWIASFLEPALLAGMGAPETV